jgi:hypothetical protein
MRIFRSYVSEMDSLLPVARLARWIHRERFGIPDDEARACRHCGQLVEPHAGVKSKRDVFCGDECFNADTDAYWV